MIPERYMVTAQAVDGGERVTGYLIRHLVDGDLTQNRLTSTVEWTTMDETGKVHAHYAEADPATIQPVKVKPIMDFGWICPNCGAQKISGRVNYCCDCGQAITWG